MKETKPEQADSDLRNSGKFGASDTPASHLVTFRFVGSTHEKSKQLY